VLDFVYPVTSGPPYAGSCERMGMQLGSGQGEKRLAQGGNDVAVMTVDPCVSHVSVPLDYRYRGVNPFTYSDPKASAL